MRPFGISVEPADGQAVVAVTGELDLAVSPKLESSLTALELSPGSTLVLDLSDVDFLDSSGLRVIVVTQHRAEEQGFRFVVVRGREPVDRIFKLTGMDEQLEVVASRDDLAPVDG